MSDKVQLIKEEIERIIEEETPISKGSDYYHGAKESMNKLLQFINSLPEELVNDEEIEALNDVRYLNPGLDSLYLKLKKS